MTMNLTRLTARSGVDYLLKTIARGDAGPGPGRGHARDLVSYYALGGTPPGTWWGRGVQAAEIDPDTPIGREGADNLFKNYRHPDTGVELGSRPRGQGTGKTTAVAGFDLTFTIPKSVSVVWAMADDDTQARILAAHERAIDAALEYMEDKVLQSRSGTNGVAAVAVRGMIAGRFNHWDSREGDPHLHTHAVISNRVQRVSDGKWLSIDSRTLHRAAVSVSELHENLLLDELHRSLGMTFTETTTHTSQAVTHDVAGVDAQTLAAFSTRHTQIAQALAAAVTAWTDEHGTAPTGKNLARIHQNVWRATRKPKPAETVPLRALRTRWRRRAEAAGLDADALVASTIDHDRDVDATAAVARDSTLALDYAAMTLDGFAQRQALAVVEQVKGTRSTWTLANLRAEAERLTRGVRCSSPLDRRVMIDAVVQAAATASLEVSERRYQLHPGAVGNPSLALRGSSIFDDDHSRVFTDQSILDAEHLVRAAATTGAGPSLDRAAATVRLGALSSQQKRDRRFAFALDQLDAAAAVLSDGRTVSAVVGPAGTGKTTTMRAVKALWEEQYGVGSVTGLTTSAQAASVLGGELEAEATTMAKWLHETVGDGARQRSATLAAQQGILDSPTATERDKARARRASAAALARSARWRITPGQLVIVDEASMTGTFALAEVTRQVQNAGGKLLLVGDPAQLDAVDAGGVLGWLERSGQATHLTSVWRFKAEWEKTASLDLRSGLDAGIAAYIDNGRVRHGSDEQVLEDAFLAARQDQHAGRSTVLIAATNTVAADLNQRFTLERRATGEVSIDTLAPLRGGTTAGVGDLVLARKVDRNVRDSAGDFVRNGTQMTVTEISETGALTAVRSDNGATITLPASWSRENVELGYAITAHRAQGTTVDAGHVAIPSQNSLTRELLYVAMTRGRQSNVAWVGEADAHDTHDHLIHPEEAPDWRSTLEAIVATSGMERTAHEVKEQVHQDYHSLARLTAERQHLLSVVHDSRGTTHQQHIAAMLTDAIGPELATAAKTSDRYGALAAEISRQDAAGVDVHHELTRMAGLRSLIDADDKARVLLWRLEHAGTRTAPVTGAKDAVAHRNLVAGDPALDDMLTQSAALIQARLASLASKAWSGEVWAQRMGAVGTDPAWREALASAAIYRDRFSWSGGTALGPAPSMMDREKFAAWSATNELLEAVQQARGRKAPAPALTQVDGAATAPSRETHPTLH
ncbi:MobF family relaxase [Sanguibacter suarezii]|uniref:MobF family relaxase n=1 Tax=Sanguibacter suarezii TaxID=60921 RepID=UPI00082FCECC|nr:MobF family relaxase [Sanguibacter suarezii]